MIYTKLVIERDQPNAPGQQPAGNVLLKLSDLEQREIVIEIGLADWSRALLLHKPVTAWVVSGQPLKEIADA